MSLQQRIVRQFSQFSTTWVVLLYVVFALVVTWPLVLHLDDAVIGDMQSDVWKHLWGFWWVKQCLFEKGVLPLYTHLLNYPYGGSLFFIDPLGAVLSLPLQMVLPLGVAYNLIV